MTMHDCEIDSTRVQQTLRETRLIIQETRQRRVAMDAQPQTLSEMLEHLRVFGLEEFDDR